MENPGKHLKPPEMSDRISNLSDPLLHHILSNVPLKYAIRTSCLSKRWYPVWKSLPDLVLSIDEVSPSSEVSGHTFLVDTLLQYRSPTIHKLSIILGGCSEKILDFCARFAFNHCVKHLEILLDWNYQFFPMVLFSNQFLTRLSLRGGCANWFKIKDVNWPSLTQLSLYNFFNCTSVFEVAGFFDMILRGCPVLESLKLVGCNDFGDLNIVSPTLKELVLDFYYLREAIIDVDVGHMSLSAPCLQSLVISGPLCCHRSWEFEDFESLLEASLAFHLYDNHFDDNSFIYDADYDHVYRETSKRMVNDFLVSVRRVKKLSLGSWFLQVLSLRSAKVLPSPLSTCASLSLDSWLEIWDLPGLASLLRSCPLLEVLTIDMSKYISLESSTILLDGFPTDYDGKSFWSSELQCECFESLLQHLRFVNIIGLGPHHDVSEPFLEFLQFLLRQGKALEKISINTMFNRYRIQDVLAMFEVSRMLLNSLRSSSVAIQLT